MVVVVDVVVCWHGDIVIYCVLCTWHGVVYDGRVHVWTC